MKEPQPGSLPEEDVTDEEDEDIFGPVDQMAQSELEWEINFLFDRYVSYVSILTGFLILFTTTNVLVLWDASWFTALAVMVPLVICLLFILIVTGILIRLRDVVKLSLKVGFVESCLNIFQETPFENMLLLPAERISSVIQRHREVTGEVLASRDHEKTARKASRMRLIGQLFFNWIPTAIACLPLAFVVLLLVILWLIIPWAIWDFMVTF